MIAKSSLQTKQKKILAVLVNGKEKAPLSNTELFTYFFTETVDTIFDLCKKHAAPSCILIYETQNVLTNIMMLKKHFLTSHIPLIFVCNSHNNQIIHEAINSGIDDYFVIQRSAENFTQKITLSMNRSMRDLSANPLTKLPGNDVIKNAIRHKSKNAKILHIDINNFKKYNDAHGFLKGDEIIQKTASILKQVLLDYGDTKDFLGHIGGDDFIIITTTNHSLLADNIKKRFSHSVKDLTISVDLVFHADIR